MVAINFPDAPFTGQVFTVGSSTWTWDGFKWASGLTPASYLPLSGGTMSGSLILAHDPTAQMESATKGYADAVKTYANGAFLPVAGGTMVGPLVLPGPPTAPLQAADKAYVDALPVAMNDNRIINGDMRIDQRNNGASGTGGSLYMVDRWFNFLTQANKGTWGRNLGASALAPGFPYYLGFSTAGAYTLLATDAFGFFQPIEADMVSDFQWGTATAQPVTLSFWAFSNIAGTFGGSLRNYANTRAYPFTYVLVANTWTKVVITIPGDTTGTWVLSGNGGSINLTFDYGSGSNFRAAAGVWGAGNIVGATGATSLFTAANQVLNLTGLKLEVGSTATPYNRQSLAKSMADCQRYYNALNSLYLFGYNTSPNNWNCSVTMPTMRAAPTITLSSITYNNCSGANSQFATPGSYNVYATTTATGTAFFVANHLLSAEL